MKSLNNGHLYELENFENKDAIGQMIQFIEKVPAGTNSNSLITVHDGTTNEEVLKMIIDRMICLQGKFPCDENAHVIHLLTAALYVLEKRTQDRVTRKVEGTNKA